MAGSEYFNEQPGGYVLPVAAAAVGDAGMQFGVSAVVRKDTHTIIESGETHHVFTGSAPTVYYLPEATGSGKVHTLSNEGTITSRLEINAGYNNLINGSQSHRIPRKSSVTVLDYAVGFWSII